MLLPSLTNHVFADVLKGIEQVADIAGLSDDVLRTTDIVSKKERRTY